MKSKPAWNSHLTLNSEWKEMTEPSILRTDILFWISILIMRMTLTPRLSKFSCNPLFLWLSLFSLSYAKFSQKQPSCQVLYRYKYVTRLIATNNCCQTSDEWLYAYSYRDDESCLGFYSFLFMLVVLDTIKSFLRQYIAS